MRCGSLFSGAGLLDAGLHQAGISHAWFVEREPDRRALLEGRWPGRPVHDDVRDVGAHNLERVDLIAGGFPCKGASNAGPRTGFAHPETALWAEFERIVRELRPRYVAVENVAAIRGLHGGAVWGTVLGDLAALGYDVAWGCVRAADVGAPHGRDRIFAVARHPDKSRADTHAEAGASRAPTRQRSGVVADSSHVGSERRGPARVGRAGSADGGERVAVAAGAARDGDGGPGAQAGADRERVGAGDRREATANAASGPEGRDPENAADRLAPEPQRSDGVAVEWEAAADAGGAPGRQLPGNAPSAQASDGGRSAELDHEPGSAGAGGLPAAGVAVEWGVYEPAIRRWEHIHGPAPAPLTRVRRVDDGDAKVRRVRARMDRQRLSALGDGVHVYVGRLLGEAIMALAGADRDEAKGQATHTDRG